MTAGWPALAVVFPLACLLLPASGDGARPWYDDGGPQQPSWCQNEDCRCTTDDENHVTVKCEFSGEKVSSSFQYYFYNKVRYHIRGCWYRRYWANTPYQVFVPTHPSTHHPLRNSEATTTRLYSLCHATVPQSTPPGGVFGIYSKRLDFVLLIFQNVCTQNMPLEYNMYYKLFVTIVLVLRMLACRVGLGWGFGQARAFIRGQRP